jgi:hypothetical protein
MRSLLRKPLLWMVVAEFAIVAALVVVAWQLVAVTQTQAAPVLPSAPLPAADAGTATGPVSVNVPTQASVHGPPPGLNVGAGFWRSRLADLNRSEAAFELLEWKLVHSAMDTIHRYLEAVVLPSIVRAEHAKS